MTFYWLLLGILSVWRVTHLLYAEDGPWDLLVRLRQRAGEGVWGKLLDCFYCLSLWIGLPFALLIGEGWKDRFMLWLSLSGGAILLQRLAYPAEIPLPAPFVEDKEQDHGVLRTETRTTDDSEPPAT
jgi:hypothetical protein